MTDKIKLVVNENLVVDTIYEVIKDIPGFNAISMDKQGEIIVHLRDSLYKQAEKVYFSQSLKQQG